MKSSEKKHQQIKIVNLTSLLDIYKDMKQDKSKVCLYRQEGKTLLKIYRQSASSTASSLQMEQR